MSSLITTGSSGRATFIFSKLLTETVTFTVLAVTHPSYEFAPSLGVTQIVVSKYGGAVVSAVPGSTGVGQAAWAMAADAALAEAGDDPDDWPPAAPRAGPTRVAPQAALLK